MGLGLPVVRLCMHSVLPVNFRSTECPCGGVHYPARALVGKRVQLRSGGELDARHERARRRGPQRALDEIGQSHSALGNKNFVSPEGRRPGVGAGVWAGGHGPAASGRGSQAALGPRPTGVSTRPPSVLAEMLTSTTACAGLRAAWHAEGSLGRWSAKAAIRPLAYWRLRPPGRLWLPSRLGHRNVRN